MNSLQILYFERYKKTNVLADLELAIRAKHDMVVLKLDHHYEQATFIQDLGNLYSTKYQRTQNLADIELAVQYYDQAIDATPMNHPDRGFRLWTLGDGYGNKYLKSRVMADLETARQKTEEALEVMPKDGLPYTDGNVFHSLGVTYHLLYEATSDLSHLDMAIQRLEAAVQATTIWHDNRAERLSSLGHAYHVKYQRTRASADLHSAIQRYQESLDYVQSPTRRRLESSRDLILLYMEAGETAKAYNAASTALSLVSELVPRSLEASDKQALLGQIGRMASDGAAVAMLASQSPYEMMRLLELGRGLIIASLSEMRSDLGLLQAKYPQLADEYISSRNQLDSLAVSGNRSHQSVSSIPSAHQINERYDAGNKLEQTIQDIRALPGFDRFLMAPSEQDLTSAATRGPVVVINVSIYRCDALIIDKDQLRVVPLPHLHNSDIEARAGTLGHATSIDTKLLEWLWDTLADPILKALGLDEGPAEACEWNRVLWIPTGPLTKFPIHAAGYHGDNLLSKTVLDRVISSYAPSVRALIQSQENLVQAHPQHPSRMTLVGMPELPYALQEVDRLQKLCKGMDVHTFKSASKDALLASLKESDISISLATGRQTFQTHLKAHLSSEMRNLLSRICSRSIWIVEDHFWHTFQPVGRGK